MRSIKRQFLGNRKLTKAEIENAGETVRANLIDAVVQISAKLANVGLHDLTQIAKLTDTAQKLFAWPSVKPGDANNSLATLTNGAINVQLIRTTPDQLRAKAKEMEVSKLAVNE
jgi:hypothetical protein